MGFPTKVQLIKRKESQQWYINFPSAVAQAMEFRRGEVVEWLIEDKAQMVLRRMQPPPSALKKKPQPASSGNSSNSGRNAETPSSKNAPTNGPKSSC